MAWCLCWYLAWWQRYLDTATLSGLSTDPLLLTIFQRRTGLFTKDFYGNLLNVNSKNLKQSSIIFFFTEKITICSLFILYKVETMYIYTLTRIEVDKPHKLTCWQGRIVSGYLQDNVRLTRESVWLSWQICNLTILIQILSLLYLWRL